MNAPIPPDAVAVCCLRVTDIVASLSNPRSSAGFAGERGGCAANPGA